eukprot:TRINITY_DN780_c3_g1_i1.p1 TRINITY_DN780_c3_g1~~TRINITY_DN780_c3_g1_i1.p1  ORF type:complete len:279 (+),score=135.35 TRINITY_DN780_c3_g1_i1:72-908(+)
MFIRSVSSLTKLTRINPILKNSLKQTHISLKKNNNSLLINFNNYRFFHQTNFNLHKETLAIHRDTPDNNNATPFEFNEESLIEVKKEIAKYPAVYKKSGIMPLLHIAQRQEGWVSLSAMNKIAKILEVTPMAVYEVATFYTMYRREPAGKYVIEVCTTTPCMLRGAYDIVDHLKRILHIDVGQTTEDGLFTLGEVECLGACVNAPMLQIGDYYYEDLDENSTTKLIESLKQGNYPPPGPQSGLRKSCEPAGVRTCLSSIPQGQHCRPLPIDKKPEQSN